MKSSVELLRAGAGSFAEQRALEQRLGDLLAGAGHRDGDAEVALDALVLADQHIEDHAVDGIVRAVVGDDADLGLLLAEAVHPAFALLVARRVPGQVVMQHGVEVLLEVDALGQAVGADQHVLARLGDQAGDACFALGGRQQAGHRLDPHLGGQCLAQLAGHVLGGVHEPAEDDGLEAVLEQRLDLADGALELVVGFGGEGFGPPGELQQLAARARRRRSRCRSRG